MLRIVLGILLLVSGLSSAFAAIKGEPVEYKADGVVMKGYLAYDDSIKGKRPGVLVIPDWWGQTDFARSRARAFAEIGYTALVVDMYGGGKEAADKEDAGKLATSVRNDAATMQARFNAGRDVLRKQTTVDPTRIAAVGYSLGANIVLEMARRGADLAGVASFYGRLTTQNPAKKGQVKAKVLVLHAGDDAFIPQEQIKPFKDEMQAAGVDYKVVVYPGVKHSFDRPDADARAQKFNLPVAYNAEADKQSWAELQAFLNRGFKK